jgi:hypothetical protein
VNPPSVAERDRPLPGIRTPAQAGGFATMQPPRRARRSPRGEADDRHQAERRLRIWSRALAQSTPGLPRRCGPCASLDLPGALLVAAPLTGQLRLQRRQQLGHDPGALVRHKLEGFVEQPVRRARHALHCTRTLRPSARPRRPPITGRRARGRRTVGRLRARDLHRALVDPSDCLPGSCRPLTWRSPFRTSSRRSRPVGTRAKLPPDPRLPRCRLASACDPRNGC